MTDVSIHEFSDMVAPDEDCVLMVRQDESTVKVVHIGNLESCLALFEEDKHMIARHSDIQAAYDRQIENEKEIK